MADMVSLDNILLHLLDVVADDIHVRVFLAVDGALLQAHEDLGELHRCRCRAEGVPVGNVILVGHDTDFLTLEVIN